MYTCCAVQVWYSAAPGVMHARVHTGRPMPPTRYILHDAALSAQSFRPSLKTALMMQQNHAHASRGHLGSSLHRRQAQVLCSSSNSRRRAISRPQLCQPTRTVGSGPDPPHRMVPYACAQQQQRGAAPSRPEGLCVSPLLMLTLSGWHLADLVLWEVGISILLGDCGQQKHPALHALVAQRSRRQQTHRTTKVSAASRRQQQHSN